MSALLMMLSPFAPHMVEEMWELLGFAAERGMACRQPWPAYDESKTIEAEVTLAVQVGGKLKGTVSVPVDSDDQTCVDAALALDKVAKMLETMTVVKTIVVKNKLVNVVMKPKA